MDGWADCNVAIAVAATYHMHMHLNVALTYMSIGLDWTGLDIPSSFSPLSRYITTAHCVCVMTLPI